MNESILAVESGNTSAKATVSFDGFAWPGGGGEISGHVPAGTYEAEIKVAEWVDKKSGTGKNLKIKAMIVSPPNAAGTVVIAYHPAPIGDDKAGEAGANIYRSIVASMLDLAGKLQAVITSGASVEVAPGSLVGKRVVIKVEDQSLAASGNYPARVVSAIKAYLPKSALARDDEPEASPDDGNEPEIKAPAAKPKTKPTPAKAPAPVKAKADDVDDFLGGI